MFARVTPYKMKADKIDEGKALLEAVKDDILALPGLISFSNVVNDDGGGYVVAVVESEEIANANMDKVQAIWGRFASVLAEPPAPAGYDVLMHWSR